jgi:ribulose bisphosphate carboxylase small subunit
MVQTTKWPTFGRHSDLKRILQRVEHPGVTFICALPAQGKTRLLVEIRDVLVSSSYATGDGGGVLVGYDEAAQETSNTLLRALKDLYMRWLSNASYAQQAKKVWKDQRGHLVEKFGQLAGKTGELLGEATGMKLGGLVDGFFGWLLEANQDLKAGIAGLTTAISYDQTRDLLDCLHQITGRRTVLFLDAFEKSANIKRDADNLDRFLRHLDEWPPCHFLVAVRSPPAADEQGELEGFRAAERLRQEHPSQRMELYRLGPMELSDSELDTLAQAIRARLAHPQDWFDEIDWDTWLKLLNSYPGTLARWMTETPSSLEDLARLAHEAEQKQYTQLLSQLRELCDQQRPIFRIAVRLALLPAMRPDVWQTLKPIVLDNDAPADALADLQKFRVLQQQNPPSFGHDTRLAAARHFVQSADDLRPYLPEQVKHLILSCARRLTRVDSDSVPFVESLLGLAFLSETLDLEDWILGLLVPPYLIMPSKSKEHELLEKWRTRMLQAALQARSDRSLAPFVSMGIFAEFERTVGERAEQWLNELRLLYEAHRDNAPVLEWFIEGLLSAFEKATGEIVGQRLAEFQQLYESRQWDDALYMSFMATVVNCSKRVKGEKKELLMPLFTKILGGKKENKDLLDAMTQAVKKAQEESSGAGAELFLELAQKAYEEDKESAQSRQSFADWLFKLLTKASGEKAERWLQQLREVFEEYPDDGFVRERLAITLANVLVKVEGENAAQLLDELRTLYEAHHADSVVQNSFATGLWSVLEKADSEKRAELLDELRKMYGAHSEETVVRQSFVGGLFYAFNQVTGEEAQALLGELRAIYQAYREDASVREPFGRALLQAMLRNLQNDDGQAAQSLEKEFRTLCSQHQDDPRLAEQLRALEKAIEQASAGQPPSEEEPSA